MSTHLARFTQTISFIFLPWKGIYFPIFSDAPGYQPWNLRYVQPSVWKRVLHKNAVFRYFIAKLLHRLRSVLVKNDGAFVSRNLNGKSLCRNHRAGWCIDEHKVKIRCSSKTRFAKLTLETICTGEHIWFREQRLQRCIENFLLWYDQYAKHVLWAQMSPFQKSFLSLVIICLHDGFWQITGYKGTVGH